MVNLDDYLDGDEDGDGEAADFAALKDALKALADAIASTNLAVINAVQDEPMGATQRVQASVAALTRFHEAFTRLDTPAADDGADEDDA